MLRKSLFVTLIIICIAALSVFVFFILNKKMPSKVISTGNKIATSTLSKQIRMRIARSGVEGARFGLVTSTPIDFTTVLLPGSVHDEDGFAKGKIKITNLSAKPLSIALGTHILSENGIEFVTKEQALVPPQSFVFVSVEAVKSGITGNISPQKFSFADSKLKRNANAIIESEESFVGGIIHVGVFSEEDKIQAEINLTTEAALNGKKNLENIVGGASAAYKVGEISITFDDSNIKTGGVIAHVSSSIIAVTYPDNTIANNQESIIEDYDLVNGTATIVFTPVEANSNVDNTAPASSGGSGSSSGSVNSDSDSGDANNSPSAPFVQEIPVPPEEKAIAACQNKSTGAACQFTVPEYVFTGTCSIITMGILECVPDSR
ncbi:MAG: baseplate J/gp47 family protein [Candidatus Magasanikbacteria bacterium]|nr:baseplate J/gp47 family protein [Candidatus Magasanikbacteria bacterium]